MPDRQIIIKLDSAPGDNALSASELVQTEAIAKFRDLLNVSLNELETPRERLKSRERGTISSVTSGRRHNAILLNGGRGSGKTTLLKSLISALPSGRQDATEFKSSLSLPVKGVQFLDVIDPNLIETKDNILILIICLIKDAVDPKLRDLPRHRENGATTQSWQESLRKLSGGLSRLDRIGRENPHDDWEDALYVMQTGLQKAGSSIDFEASFHEFIDLSLEILDKRLFVIAFDDIDTAFNRGWDVLEVIRKYLATPALLVILSGDLELYSKIVRLEQWRKLEPNLIRMDGGEQEYKPRVDQLEDQYIMKLLEPVRRIQLSRLNDILAQGLHILVQAKDQDPKPIESLLKISIEKHFQVQRAADLSVYQSLIFRQPIRTVLQFLHAFQPEVSDHEFRQAIADIALGALVRRSISPDQLASARDQEYLYILRDYLNRTGLWAAGYRLRPDVRGNNDDDNFVILALAAPLTKAVCQNPALIFDYFVKVALPHQAADYVPKDAEAGMTRYLKFVSRNLNDDSLMEARQNVAVIVESNGKAIAGWSISRGVIRVISRSQATEVNSVLGTAVTGITSSKGPVVGRLGQEKDHALGEFRAKISELSTEKYRLGHSHNTVLSLKQRISSPILASLAMLPFCEVVNRNAYSATYLSIFNLLGGLAVLTGNKTPGGETAANDLANQLMTAGQLRSFPVPNWDSQSSDARVRDDEDGDLVDDDSRFDSLDNDKIAPSEPFLMAMARWREELGGVLESRYGKGDGASMHFLSRVWSRFYFTLERAKGQIPQERRYLGWMLHRQIIAFLSAVLTEEATDKSTFPKLSLVNPTSEDKPFLTNLGYALDLNNSSVPADINPAILEERVPIFAIFFACPLWAVYLYPRQMLQTMHGKQMKLWDVQIRQWARWIVTPSIQSVASTDIKRAYDLLNVNYSPTMGGKTVSFANLFDPISSILVAGASEVTTGTSRSKPTP